MQARNSRKILEDTKDYCPKRFGLIYNDPPIIGNPNNKPIVLEYLVPSIGKLYRHRMKLPRLAQLRNGKEVSAGLYKKHEVYLSHPRISNRHIEGRLR